jgi:hypothetical protein
MATLRSNGKCIVEMRVYRSRTDGADGDEMTMNTVTIYRAMSSGKVLKKSNGIFNYGVNGTHQKCTGHWLVCGKIKAELVNKGNSAIFEAMQSWADQLRDKGMDVEIS